MKRKLIFKYFLATNCQTEFMRCNWICKMQLLSHTFEFCALKCTTKVLFMVYLYSSEIKWKIFQKYLKISKFFSSNFLFPPQTKSRQRIALFQVVPETIVVKRKKGKGHWRRHQGEDHDEEKAGNLKIIYFTNATILQ